MASRLGVEQARRRALLGQFLRLIAGAGQHSRDHLATRWRGSGVMFVRTLRSGKGFRFLNAG